MKFTKIGLLILSTFCCINIVSAEDTPCNNETLAESREANPHEHNHHHGHEKSSRQSERSNRQR